MDKIIKQQILQEINELEVIDIVELVQADDIRLEEMVDAGLERGKLKAVQEKLNSPSNQNAKEAPPVQAQDEIKQLCEEIERDEYDVLEIRSFLLSGVISPEQLKQHTSMSDEIIERINFYQKSETLNTTNFRRAIHDKNGRQ